MRITLRLKDPDGVYESIRKAVTAEVRKIDGLSKSEKEDLIQQRHDEAEEALEPWVEYAEYVTVEIDTESRTAVVKTNQ